MAGYMMAFPVIGLGLSVFSGLCAWGGSATGESGPRRGGGGRPGPERVPDPPDGGRLADAGAGTDVLAVGLPSWSEEGPDGEHDEVPGGATGSVGLPAGM
jgi:hypothetical protein